MKEPVGVFDSGLGGLTVVREIKKRWPKERIIYLGDTARVPYGTRSREVIVNFSLECARFLQRKGISKLIIACNTASAYAYAQIKREIDIPIFDVISYGARGAVETSKNQIIGVVATKATTASKAYEREIKKLNKKAKVLLVAAPLLVPLVEEGETEGNLIKEVMSKYTKGFAGFGMDTLVLGCTHYPVIAGVIKKALPGVKLVNPGEELAKRWQGENNTGEDKYYFTDMNDRYLEVAEMFLGQSLTGKAEKVSI